MMTGEDTENLGRKEGQEKGDSDETNSSRQVVAKKGLNGKHNTTGGKKISH